MNNIVSYLVVGRTNRKLCSRCEQRSILVEMTCPDCGDLHLCISCTKSHLLTLHLERDSLRELLDQAIHNALHTEAERDDLKQYTQDARKQAIMIQRVHRKLLEDLKDLSVQLSRVNNHDWENHATHS